MRVIYTAGPITHGDPIRNYRQGENAHRELMKAGFSVICPQLTMLLAHAKQFSHREWIDTCRPVVQRVDAVLRLPGFSPGSDEEEAIAREAGVPVFYDMESLRSWSNGKI